MEAGGFEKKEEASDEVPIVETLSKSEKDSAKLLIKNLEIDFNSRNFENPTI